jgi:hypothetical protein
MKNTSSQSDDMFGGGTIVLTSTMRPSQTAAALEEKSSGDAVPAWMSNS